MSTGARRPNGFAVLAVCAALFGAFAGLVLATDDGGGDVAVNTLLAAWGSLGLLTAEALWRVRRWAFPASVALAGSVLAPCVVLAVVLAMDNDVPMALLALLAGGIMVFGMQPVLAYVRDRSRSLHGAGRVAP